MDSLGPVIGGMIGAGAVIGAGTPPGGAEAVGMGIFPSPCMERTFNSIFVSPPVFVSVSRLFSCPVNLLSASFTFVVK